MSFEQLYISGITAVIPLKSAMFRQYDLQLPRGIPGRPDPRRAARYLRFGRRGRGFPRTSGSIGGLVRGPPT